MTIKQHSKFTVHSTMELYCVSWTCTTRLTHKTHLEHNVGLSLIELSM